MFRFKQFEIEQDRCAMKVGTDGVLLGAWSDVSNALRILDIGTGTGLLALMAAQRNPNAHITAIEIDPEATKQAQDNCRSSPWHDRIDVLHVSLQDFITKGEGTFDRILCNPPYFELNQQISSPNRRMARQQDQFDLSLLASACDQLLTDDGIASIVYPFDALDHIQNAMAVHALQTHRLCQVRGHQDKAFKRILIEFSKQVPSTTHITTLTIEVSRHQYTKEYQELTGDFYL